jgi:hypothetical protein
MYLKAELAVMTVLKKLKHLLVAAFEKLQHQKCLNLFETRLPVIWYLVYYKRWLGMSLVSFNYNYEDIILGNSKHNL